MFRLGRSTLTVILTVSAGINSLAKASAIACMLALLSIVGMAITTQPVYAVSCLAGPIGGHDGFSNRMPAVYENLIGCTSRSITQSEYENAVNGTALTSDITSFNRRLYVALPDLGGPNIPGSGSPPTSNGIAVQMANAASTEWDTITSHTCSVQSGAGAVGTAMSANNKGLSIFIELTSPETSCVLNATSSTGTTLTGITLSRTSLGYTAAGGTFDHLGSPDIEISSDENGPLSDGATDAHGDEAVGVAKTVTYTITNTGTADLNVTNSVPTITNAVNVGAPTVTNFYPQRITTGGSTSTFTVTYTPQSTGVFSFDIAVLTDDPDESTFDIAVLGTTPGAGSPEINIQGNGQDIASGDTSPATIDDTDFGNVTLGTPVQRTFTIQNTGTKVLNISSITTTSGDYSISGTPISVAVNASETFNIDLTATAIGTLVGFITVNSDDVDEGSYTFGVTANASGPEISISSSETISILDDAAESHGTQGIGIVKSVTYTINNSGNAALELTGVAPILTSSTNLGTPVIGNYSSTSVAENGGTVTFTVDYTPESVGAFSLGLQINSNDFDEGVFDFTISGTAIDLSAPFLLSVERHSPTTEITNADTLTWRLTFSEAIVNLDTADVEISGTTATITALTAVSGSIYDLTISGGDLASLNGEVESAFADSGVSIQDAAGNDVLLAAPTGTDENTFTLVNDIVNPRIVSIERRNPSSETTDRDILIWYITFDESVTGVDVSDFSASGTTATITSVAALSTSNDFVDIPNSVYSVTVAGGDLASLNGTVTLSPIVGSNNIEDTSGNGVIDATPTLTNNNSYTLVNDVAPPRIASIMRHSPTTETTQEDTLTWQFTFDEAVTGVDTSDFTVSGTTGAVADVETVSTTIYNVNVAGGDLASVATTVSIDAKSSGTNIADANGNVFDNSTPTGANDNFYNIELPIASTTIEVVSDEGKTVADGGSDEQSDEPAGSTVTNTYTFTNTSSSPITIDGTPTIAGSNNAGNPTVSDFTAPTTNPLTKTDLTFGQRTFAYAGAVTLDVLEVISNSIVSPAYAIGSITLQPDESTSFDVTYTPESHGAFSVEVDIVSSVGTFDIKVSGAAVDATAPSVSINGAPSAHDNSTPFNVTFEFSEDVTGFLVGDITLSNGSASNFVAVDGNTYTADITPTGTSDITIDVASAVAVDGGSNPNTAAVQVRVSGGATVKETQTAIANFMMNRANNLLSNQPDMIGFINGSNNNGGGPLGNLQLESDLNSETTMSFFTSRSKILQARDGGFGKGNRPTHGDETLYFASAERFGGDVDTASNLLAKKVEDHEPEPQGFGANDRTGSWDFWTQINGSKSSQTNINSEFWSANFGTHYFISNDVLIGMLTQFDWSEEINNSANSKVSGNGFMVGPYIAGKLKDQNLYYEARALWGQSSNDVTPIGTYTDSFETERWLASLKIQGSYDLNDGVTIKPEASISYFEETQEAYTDTNSNLIPEQTISLGEFKFGPTITRSFEIGSGYTMRATTGLSGVANFSVKNANTSTSNAFANEDLRARVDAKVELENEYGIRFTAAGYYDGMGASDFQSYGGTLGLIIPIY